MQLRKKAPFWCRARKPDRSFVHLGRALQANEGDVCSECEEAQKAVARKAHAPIPSVGQRWNSCVAPCPAYYGPNVCTCSDGLEDIL